MRKQKQFFLFIHFLLPAILLSGSLTFRSNAQSVKLKGDMVHSNIGFSVPLAGGLSRLTGKFNKWDITINYVDGDITKSSIHATIKAASISTGDGGRDGHLATPDFFDAEKYPDITFVSDSILNTPKGYVAYGMFSCHGVSKSIDLPFTLVGKDDEGNPGFTARYTIVRSEYGLGKKADTDTYISNSVAVEIDFIALKPKTETK